MERRDREREREMDKWCLNSEAETEKTWQEERLLLLSSHFPCGSGPSLGFDGVGS